MTISDFLRKIESAYADNSYFFFVPLTPGRSPADEEDDGAAYAAALVPTEKPRQTP